ncbi:MAG: Hsp20/alpha crystallin family protein [Armatimonadota bacterium]
MRRDQENYPMRRSRETGLSRLGDLPGSWMEPSLGFGGSPWQMMRRMQEDMDRMFGQLIGSPQEGAQQGMTAMRQWAPSVDISQTNGEWCIEADLPGVEKDQIEVEVQDHHLVLRAEMRQESGDEQGGEGRAGEGRAGRQYHHRERRYGFFQRVIPLPENVDEENIRCEFRNGVLTVHVPQSERPAGARRIPVSDVDTQRPITAGGRQRSEGEMRQAVGSRQPGQEEYEEERELAGAKGGETSSPTGGEKQTSGGRSSKKTEQPGGNK